MSKQSEEFFSVILDFFPSKSSQYRESIEYYGEILETVIIEDLFMPDIIRLVSENKNINLLKMIFDYFETVSNCDDEHLINIFSVTVLEILGNDKEILKKAKEFMGPKTIQLQIQADRALGRI